MRIDEEADGLVVEGAWYRLRLPSEPSVGWLEDRATGERWAQLRLLTSVDTLDGVDETLNVGAPALHRGGDTLRLAWPLSSSRWTAKRLVLEADDDGLAFHAEVDGMGAPTDVRLLGGRAVLPRTGGGLLHSGSWFQTVLCPSPTDPARIVKPASESALIGVASGSEPGRGNWFFTPGPFCYAVSRAPVAHAAVIPEGPWLTFGLEVAPGAAGFVGFGYRAVDRGFSFSLDYEGKTAVAGTWRTPAIRIARAADGTDAYAAIASYGLRLRQAGLVPRGAPGGGDRPAWWRQPIVCGWGEQCRLALLDGRGFGAAPGYATEAVYEDILAGLAARGVVPGTIVIDDKWQLAYGTNEPDPAKWPDLRGWIARRHDRGQRVLLWWKAWDPEGLPQALTVTSAAGAVLGLDASNPAARDAVRDAVLRMLGPDGLDADGLKIDFTARTPSGVATRHHGGSWGVELLRLLLDTVREEARRVKPQSLLVGHVPNELVAGAVDMLRLNDTLRLDDPQPRVDVVSQMRYRAAVVRAACPDHLVDTDDWCAPDLATWRAYLAAKVELGVPALYYATGLDLSREAFTDGDYELLRHAWAAYRRREELPEPPG